MTLSPQEPHAAKPDYSMTQYITQQSNALYHSLSSAKNNSLTSKRKLRPDSTPVVVSTGTLPELSSRHGPILGVLKKKSNFFLKFSVHHIPLFVNLMWSRFSFLRDNRIFSISGDEVRSCKNIGVQTNQQCDSIPTALSMDKQQSSNRDNIYITSYLYFRNRRLQPKLVGAPLYWHKVAASPLRGHDKGISYYFTRS